MPSGSDWGRGGGSAKDRRAKYAARLVNRSTGEAKRPNQREIFRAGNDTTFRRNRYTGKYEAQVDLPF